MYPKLTEIERAHCVGKNGPIGCSRSVLLKLDWFKDKEEILKQAKLSEGYKPFDH